MKKISFQKIFCFISFLFILSCCIFYGTRFIKLYLANREIISEEKDTLVQKVRISNENNENFKLINGENYFTGNDESNYLVYSNILWRIIKVNSDNSLTVISNNSITSLAYGKELAYKDSHINKWLNKTEEDYTGILENVLNDKETYLQKTNTCNDIIDKLTNNPCNDIDNNNYITLLSISDFLNVGSTDSYLNNNEYYYLSNTNTENKVWYVNEDGKASLNQGTDIIGVRPVITIKTNIEYLSGTGSQDDPYIIEETPALFGSYVKIDNDIWRIYQVNETEVRLMLNNYLTVNNNELKYQYSNNNSYYDDYKQNSIAYYLNRTFLNSLSYKDKIKEVYWTNGYYNSQNNYDYTTALKEEINSKVALVSMGDIILNNELSNYFTMTGSTNKGTMVYTIQENKRPYTKQIQQAINVVPTISIDKELLTKGTGTLDSPLEME